MSTAIEFNNISKLYRLGLVSTKTLSHDLDRWWKVNVMHKEDPYLKIGSVNDRASAADSEYVWALRDIDFKVEQGDVIGIIGKNGAGKSTLLKLLSKVTAPTTGTIKARGRIGALLEVGTGFHQEMTGRENIYLNGAIMGMTKQEISRKLDEIVSFSGCERYIDTPVKRYSSGMTVRLGFAVAAHLDPEILVVDEVLAVGDAEFQKKAIGKMQDVSSGEGRTVLFVSHNMASIRALCSKGILLDKGSVSYEGPIETTISKYLSENTINSGEDILSRLDKKGNKRVEITDVVFRDKKGDTVSEIFTGEMLDIEWHYRVNDKDVDLSKLIVAAGFCDDYGSEIVEWVSDEMKTDFGMLTSGKFTLHIPELSLRPASYHLTYQISLGSTSKSDFCDQLDNAKLLTVIGSDFYSNGSVISRFGHSFLVKADFKL